MRRGATRSRPKGEPTIALINVVFLMLVFFLVAGSLASPLDPEISLVALDELEGRHPPNALMLHADGTVTWRGETIDPAHFTLPDDAQDRPGHLRLIPDRDLPAARLMEIAAALQSVGAEELFIVTERGLK
jgi:biopolymer transport protein ExbD